MSTPSVTQDEYDRAIAALRNIVAVGHARDNVQRANDKLDQCIEWANEALTALAAAFAERDAKAGPAYALQILREAFAADMSYAWTWHCNVAMAAVDAGAPHGEANERAADFMRNAFAIDTRQCAEYAAIAARSAQQVG